MGSRLGETDSPSASSSFLPLLKRRSSVISVASQVDKETLNQALDNIHNVASQSETLTTFNEYTAPPAASSTPDVKGIAGDLQGGLSGLYSRLRASVGSPKEQSIGNVDATDDASSTKSSKLTSSITLPPRQSTSKGVPTPSPAPSSPSISRDVVVTDQLVSSQHSGGSTSQKQESSQDRSKPVTEGSSASAPKPKRPAGPPGRASLGPSTQKLAEPTLAGVIVNATKSNRPQSQDSADVKDSVSTGPSSTQKSSTDQSNNDQAKEKRGSRPEIQQQADSKSVSELSKKTPVATPSDVVSPPPETASKTSYFGDDDGRASDYESDDQDVEALDESNDRKEPTVTFSKEASNPPSAQKPKGKGLPVIHQQAPVDTPSRQYPNKRLGVAPLSRNNSSDGPTTGSTSRNSYHQIASDEESLHTVGDLPPKSKARSGVGQRHKSILTSIKHKVLSKEYWMRDENARDCFYCGDPFSTFRRKHHCRTCGQIFDAKCTVLISGTPFGQAGTLRVCKPCENIINAADDSSEVSDDGSVVGHGARRRGSSGTSELTPVRSFTSLRAAHSESRGDAVPTIAIPATRKLKDESRKRPDVLEIDAEAKPPIPRPGSSRSLKSVTGFRPHSSSHRRHHSRSILGRQMKLPPEDAAPFHRDSSEQSQSQSRLPAFHSDNVIDPELADFMSDENSSGDEHPSIMSAISGDITRTAESDKPTVSGLFPSRKTRSRRGEKSISGMIQGRDSDSVSINSARMSVERGPKRRNMSITGNTLLRPAPRIQRYHSSGMITFADNQSVSGMDAASSPGGERVTRSSAMKGAEAPAIELNSASIQHVRRLLSQLLGDANIPNLPSWEKALMPILLKATDDVTPDVQNGDDMDIRHYIKLKKIPGGKPGDTSYVSGLVFTKNLAHKNMSRKIPHPNILIITFPLEYSRHKQHFMSLDLLIRQEREYLWNLVQRIVALKPQVLLCEKNIAGLALEFLESQGIATASNVKASVLEAVSRCAQTRIIHSIDKLAVKPAQAGRCALFYLKTYVHNNRRKTYMFLSGCPKELGCTIVLRGAEPDVLRKLKRITEFMLFVVYNLKLETSLMRDEFALIPNYTGAGTIAPDKETTKTSTEYVETRRSVAVDVKNAASGSAQQATSQLPSNDPPKEPNSQESSSDLPKLTAAGTTDSDEIPDDVTPTFYGDLVEQYKDKILSASPFVRFMPPFLLYRAREQERRLVYLKRLLDQHPEEDYNEKAEDIGPEKFSLIKPDMMHESVDGMSKKMREVVRAAQYAEYEKAVHNYRTQRKQWEAYVATNEFMFDPFAHQSITVLYSTVCMATSIPCDGPHILSLGFYKSHFDTDEDTTADCTLGEYVEELCLHSYEICSANGCDKRMLEHHRQYVHGSSQLSVTVEPHPPKLRGYQDIILMWSVCRICGKETQEIPMSENTWKYSYGKYLELSFWSHDLHARAGICSHDLHRNHLRFFGFKNMAVRLQYDSISLLEIVVPRTRITWKVVNDLNFKNESFSKAEERINRFYYSVKKRVDGIKLDSVVPERTEAAKDEIARLKLKADEEHLAVVAQLQASYMDSKYWEIVPFNEALHYTQTKVPVWDSAFAEFDRNYFPSEKDISRLAALQLKKIFLDRDESVSSLTSNEDSGGSLTEIDLSEKTSPEDPIALVPQTRNMSPDQARDMLSAVVENHSGSPESENHKVVDRPQLELEKMAPLGRSATVPVIHPTESEEVRHLDLAVPSNFSPPLQGADISHLDSGSASPVAPKSPLTTEGIDQVERHIRSSTPSREPQSSIPRPSEGKSRRSGVLRSPSLIRTQSQPAHMLRSKTGNSSLGDPIKSSGASSSNAPNKNSKDGRGPNDAKPEKRLSERLGLTALKTQGQSMIPRSIASRRKESKVSTLAKHFEQLSKEFEKERLRDRNKRATRTRLGRAYPNKASKPTIEVYRNVHEAVLEQELSDDEQDVAPVLPTSDEHKSPAEAMTQNTANTTPVDGLNGEDSIAGENTAENTDIEDSLRPESRLALEAELEALKSDEEHLMDLPNMADAKQILSPSEAQLDLRLDLPKHEKKSLMNMLRNFWAERSASGWDPLEYVMRQTDHIFKDSPVIVREDEPSSLIAFALDSQHYQDQITAMKATSMRQAEADPDKPYVEDLFLGPDEQKLIEHSLLQSKGTHLKYSWPDGPARLTCKIFWAEQFDAVRRKCGVDERIVECLSRCVRWDSKGGKTKSIFLKTLDDRLVLKSLSQIETQAFLKFAPAYFHLMGETLFHELPSAIAKMLGFYQIIIKNPITGTDLNLNVLLMENLFYDRNPTRTFDLKGSMRNRRINPTGEQNEVLLDENMVEFIYESPIFVREHSKRLLRSSVYNDTLFLARQNVMDYSLMVAIDESRKELVVGMIDCIRTYTWDKKVESWMKSGKNRPTVTSPKEYKTRFREAMNIYILQAPNCWHQFGARPQEILGRSSESAPPTQEQLREQLQEEDLPVDMDLSTIQAVGAI